MRNACAALASWMVLATASFADDDVAAKRDRQISVNNLKMIGLAMHNSHDVYAGLPAAAICDKDGKPLLSWRVAILPFLDESKLYEEFKLNEPWDSEHNQKLLERIPKVYAPVRGKTTNKYDTFYRVFEGGGALFEPNAKTSLAKVLDGTSNTLLAVEAGEAVPWTKPDELKFDAAKDLPKLGGMFDERFHVLMADGSVRAMSKKTDAALLKKLITKSGGELIERK